MNIPYAMIDDTPLSEVGVSGGRQLVPGISITGYVGTRRVEVWLHPEITGEIAAMHEPEMLFKWPWETTA